MSLLRRNRSGLKLLTAHLEESAQEATQPIDPQCVVLTVGHIENNEIEIAGSTCSDYTFIIPDASLGRRAQPLIAVPSFPASVHSSSPRSLDRTIAECLNGRALLVARPPEVAALIERLIMAVRDDEQVSRKQHFCTLRTLLFQCRVVSQLPKSFPPRTGH